MMSEYTDFKPVDRSRAYTWHAGHAGIKDSPTSGKFDMAYGMDSAGSSAGPSSKKPWSRRNAWGSMSYADLIGKAIESTADKRMTLSQIYDWMIQNVPYFHDKGTGSSSTGWKNSIRHNLSLHRRFKRVPNEDSGKSSWWMLNDAPDQCPPTRKRTVSVGKFEGKDISADLASPSAKISHIVMEPLNTYTDTPHTAGPSSDNQPWLSPVQPLARYGGITTHLPEFSQLKWHQPSAETDPFFAVDLDPAFASPSYNTPTSCTPLAPISELLSPQQFTSYDLQAVEIPSSATYVTVNTVPLEQPAFAGHSLTALSSVPMLDTSSQSTLETYAAASPTELPVTVHSSSASGTNALQAQGPLWTPGWSMLRQMLSQSHRENAVMHGVINQPSSTSEYIHSIENQPLQPSTNVAVQLISSPVATDHGFSYITTPQNVSTSDDILYVQMTADLDNASDIQQSVQLTADNTEAGTQQQVVISGYGDVHSAADVNVPKTESDNNNENVVDEKSF